MPSLADLAAGYAPHPESNMSLADIANAYANGPSPSPYAQAKFGRIADFVLNGLRSWIETPGRAMREGITTDQAVDWAAPTAMGMVGSPGVPAGALGSAAKLRPYEGAPDSLMGFRRAGQNMAFEDQAWSHIQPVRVRLPNGDVFEDAVKGLNKSHALERARRNWESGAIIEAIEG